jgi:hypothetical protein
MQTIACSHCGCPFESVNAVFVHIFTAHLGKDIAQEPKVAAKEINRMRDYRHPMCREVN